MWLFNSHPERKFLAMSWKIYGEYFELQSQWISSALNGRLTKIALLIVCVCVCVFTFKCKRDTSQTVDPLRSEGYLNRSEVVSSQISNQLLYDLIRFGMVLALLGQNSGLEAHNESKQQCEIMATERQKSIPNKITIQMHGGQWKEASLVQSQRMRRNEAIENAGETENERRWEHKLVCAPHSLLPLFTCMAPICDFIVVVVAVETKRWMVYSNPRPHPYRARSSI